MATGAAPGKVTFQPLEMSMDVGRGPAAAAAKGHLAIGEHNDARFVGSQNSASGVPPAVEILPVSGSHSEATMPRGGRRNVASVFTGWLLVLTRK